MSTPRRYRLDGLEPDNLLAFLALLGLLRCLEEAAPTWLPRVAWPASPNMRPSLVLHIPTKKAAIATAAAVGVKKLASRHDFDSHRDLKLSPEIAEELCSAAARGGDRYFADLWAALVSDAAIRDQNKPPMVEPTPLCLMFGQGHQHFLERLSAVPRESQPPDRGLEHGRSMEPISETDYLNETLFSPWTRPDASHSFRWDPHEDVRYAYRATDPTDPKTKATTQHGANRLAAIGLSAITVVPRRGPAGTARLAVLGGARDPDGSFVFSWPIWREPASLNAIRGLLGHPRLDDPATRASLGVVELRRTRRVVVGKYMNFTSAQPIF